MEKNCIYIISALCIVLPFLIRNIIISGYILYPYAGLDFFNVDWKMPAYTVKFDNHEIISWGRGLRDVEKYNWPFYKWFPIWFSELNFWNIVLLLTNIIIVVILFVYIMKLVKQKKIKLWADYLLIVIVETSCFAAWIFSAPLIRYGQVYLYLLPAVIFGWGVTQIKNKWKDICVSIVLVGIVLKGLYGYIGDAEKVSLYLPNDYPSYECYDITYQNNLKLFLPASGDRVGFQNFPAIPYRDRLDLIEMRGKKLQDGFRMKVEYRNSNVTTYGNIEK